MENECSLCNRLIVKHLSLHPPFLTLSLCVFYVKLQGDFLFFGVFVGYLLVISLKNIL